MMIIGHRLSFDSREIRSVETRMGLCDNEIHFISKGKRRALGELSSTWKNNMRRQEGNLYQRVEKKKSWIKEFHVNRLNGFLMSAWNFWVMVGWSITFAMAVKHR